ncbi:serine proteinase stubble-like isoform X1 [Cydia strobilella]|uniref:serine proteinase stubble-like isoform X1 n=1 Tax=Cydia strobilella TaxID=1100964 RepID=UPI0030077936
MAKLLYVCVFMCVQLVYCQFGFFPSRDDRGFSQSLLDPSRIRHSIQTILHIQPQNHNNNPYGYTDEYGRPISDYSRPNYDYGRPNYEYSRPNQFGIPNQNQFYNQNGANQYGFQNPGNPNNFQYPQSQNEFQNTPRPIGLNTPPPQSEYTNTNGNNVFQNPSSQNEFQNPPSQNGFPDSSQVGFPTTPPKNEFLNTNENGFENRPSQNEFQNPPSQNSFPDSSQAGFPTAPPKNEFPNTNENGFQNPPSQNEFQNPPSQNGFPDSSQVGFPTAPPKNEFPNTNANGFQNPPNQNEFQNPPSQNGFADSSQIGFPTAPPKKEFPNTNENSFQNPPSQNGFQDQPSQNSFQNEPNLVGFPDRSSFQDNPNSDNSASKEAKQNENTLIVIPGNTVPNEDGPSDAVAFPDSQKDKTPGFTKATEQTPKVTEESSTTESTTASVTTTLPPLTPVSADSRNNFNFGPSGIFQETCTTVENEVGSCISVTDCQPYLKLIQESRSNPNALRLLRQAHCGFQGNNPKVCCPRPGIPTGLPPTLPHTEPTPAPTQATEPTPGPEPKELEPQLEAGSLPEAPVCGVSNASFSRVVGGIPAKLGDFPWMALLGYKERRAGAGARWLCGGSLISSRHVLTAAHCIHTRENDLYLVRLGELDLARDDEGATPVDVLIKTLIKHQEYSPKSFTNDIGILVLSRNVQFTNLIQPICIPRSGDLRSRSYENYTPLIAGWGDTEFRGPSATHLQVLQLPVVSNDFCVQAYSAYKAQVIDQRVLCAGFKKGGKDACQGDSGGPLMQPIYNSETRTTFFYQIGVVSYGKKCAEAGFPGVYTRVTNFVPWIEETVANN